MSSLLTVETVTPRAKAEVQLAETADDVLSGLEFIVGAGRNSNYNDVMLQPYMLTLEQLKTTERNSHHWWVSKLAGFYDSDDIVPYKLPPQNLMLIGVNLALNRFHTSGYTGGSTHPMLHLGKRLFLAAPAYNPFETDFEGEINDEEYEALVLEAHTMQDVDIDMDQAICFEGDTLAEAMAIQGIRAETLSRGGTPQIGYRDNDIGNFLLNQSSLTFNAQ